MHCEAPHVVPRRADLLSLFEFKFVWVSDSGVGVLGVGSRVNGLGARWTELSHVAPTFVWFRLVQGFENLGFGFSSSPT